MSLRQYMYMTVFCLLLLVTLGNSYSMKYLVDRLNALETKLESESKLRRSETEELFRMFSELASDKIPSKVGQLTPDGKTTSSEQLTTKPPSTDKYKTTELAIELQDLESYIKGVAAEKQQNVKLRAELKNISKQLEADYTMFESRINEEIRNFTNDVSDKLTLLVSEERFNNLSEFVTTTQSELRNEAMQSIISLKSDVETSIQKLSINFQTVNITAIKSVERCNNVSDSLTMMTNDLHSVKTILQHKLIYVESCKNVPKSGAYMMYNSKSATPLRVYCDQETDGGGWLVIQRRKDGSVDFYRNWTDYKTGFGDIENEFWIGNDNIHALTSSGLNVLRIDVMDFEGNKTYVKFYNFKVRSESDLYKLELNVYSGHARGSLGWYHNGQAFSTIDRDNDKWHASSCSEDMRGAWWYGDCRYYHDGNSLRGDGIYYHGGYSPYGNLNGRYYHDGNYHYDGIWWKEREAFYYSLKTVDMKIR